LKFNKDKKKWIHWLWEARKRFGLLVLNYTVTSNHIHLLALENDQHSIAQSLHLIAGSTAQFFNRSKNKLGAFWQDRYHATIIQSKGHLIRCMAYIDLNMVRADVVTHPEEYEFAGYREIRTPKKRYQIIDHDRIANHSSSGTLAAVIKMIDHEIDKKLEAANNQRENFWSNSIAVGDTGFLTKIKNELGNKSKSKEIFPVDNDEEQKYLLEPRKTYGKKEYKDNLIPLEPPF